MSKVLPLALAVLGTGSAWSQSVISAHSGVIHYVEGQVSVDGKAVQPKFAEFPDVKTGQTLAAEDGRAEVLLTPGVFLRVAEASSVRMISNKLADTRVEILTGSTLAEVGELLADNAITLQFHDAQIALLKKGLYRIDADPGRLRVYEGEARVTSGSQTLSVKHGHEVEFGAVLETRGFDTKSTDAFYRWGGRRAEYIAEANVSAAKAVNDRGLSYASSGHAGSWAWNPYFGLFTYLPGNGIYYSPFGWAYYSPAFVSYVYVPVYRGGYSGGYNSPGTVPMSHGPAVSAGSSIFHGGGMGSGMSAPSGGGGFSGAHGGGGGAAISGGGHAGGAVSGHGGR
jgi:hypothetical protein